MFILNKYNFFFHIFRTHRLSIHAHERAKSISTTAVEWEGNFSSSPKRNLVLSPKKLEILFTS